MGNIHLLSVKKPRQAELVLVKLLLQDNRRQPDRSPVIRQLLLGMSSGVFSVVQSLVI